MNKQPIDADIYNRLKEISEMKWQATTKLVEFLETVRPKHQRTIDQNSALHVYFSQISDALNNAGLTVQEALRGLMDMEWSSYRVKDLIWRQAQKKYLGKTSTTDLDKVGEIDEVYEHINRWLGTRGIENIPFPHDPNKKKAMEEEMEMPKPYQGEYPNEEEEGIDLSKQIF